MLGTVFFLMWLVTAVDLEEATGFWIRNFLSFVVFLTVPGPLCFLPGLQSGRAEFPGAAPPGSEPDEGMPIAFLMLFFGVASLVVCSQLYFGTEFGNSGLGLVVYFGVFIGSVALGILPVIAQVLLQKALAALGLWNPLKAFARHACPRWLS